MWAVSLIMLTQILLILFCAWVLIAFISWLMKKTIGEALIIAIVLYAIFMVILS